MPLRTSISAALLAGLVVACGGEAPGADSPDIVDPGKPSAAAGSSSSDGDSTNMANRAEIEQAHNCGGLMSAAGAARMVMSDALPAEFDQIDMNTGIWWDVRAAKLRTPDMSDAEVDALVANSRRVLNTPQAINDALPEIRACLEARKTL